MKVIKWEDRKREADCAAFLEERAFQLWGIAGE